jgi:hypothetical protein
VYSFAQYIADYNEGKDMTVDEWVYDSVTKINEVMKVGPDTPITIVDTKGLKWFGAI